MNIKKETKLSRARTPQFMQLVEIVCRWYGVESKHVLSGLRLHAYTTPKNIIGALWRRGNTLQNTCDMVGWASPQQVVTACKRMSVLATMPQHAVRLKGILADCERDLPWLVADYPSAPDDLSDSG